MASPEVITLPEDEEEDEDFAVNLNFVQLAGGNELLDVKLEVEEREKEEEKEKVAELEMEEQDEKFALDDYRQSKNNNKAKTRKRARSSNSDEEYMPSDESGVEDDEKIYEENFDRKSNNSILDDNKTKVYNARIQKLEQVDTKPEYAITRNVKSDEFGDSPHPWKVDTATWNRLHEYQKEGVQWLQKKTDHRSGGILADQMGLGKTIQAAVFLRSIAETGRVHYK
uniref:SNF2 N-terminal domain-containing protein n=1 Tax=Caenorhabditis japonica TaxID=281687 RepID=A0A8R1IIF8_CAEJA